MPALSFDIFCEVIDNYGDIGVCWRLARQLKHMSAQHQVRLWVDDLESFARIEPTVNPVAAVQSVAGVDIVHWTQEAARLAPAKVVIEAFGCDLPARFVEDMRARDSIWINLEYLSAENWVEDCHARPSIQSNGLRKAFFFPGFTDATGGLLREPGLLVQRDAWLAQPRQRHELLQSIGLPLPEIEKLEGGARQVFLFCYSSAPVAALLESLRRESRPSVVLVASGVAPTLTAQSNDHVHVHACPFVDQDGFDRLLWSSDMNFVRGEDSLVRALWAAKPLIWQPYPQEEQLHIAKLQAWLDISPLDPGIGDLMLAWNTGRAADFNERFERALRDSDWVRWQKQSHDWAQALGRQRDLAQSLVKFAVKELRTG